MTSTTAVLAELADRVRHVPPRMFAIYGVYADAKDGEYPGWIQWGLEFPDQAKAVAWSPGSTHLASSAEEILKSGELMGPARLVWFG